DERETCDRAGWSGRQRNDRATGPARQLLLCWLPHALPAASCTGIHRLGVGGRLRKRSSHSTSISPGISIALNVFIVGDSGCHLIRLHTLSWMPCRVCTTHSARAPSGANRSSLDGPCGPANLLPP